MPESNTQSKHSPLDFNGPIEICRQVEFAIDEDSIRNVVSRILSDSGFNNGSISIAIVDDPTIHELNNRYLQHDYETDVLSFVLEFDDQRGWLEGELIVSSDTATRISADYGWPPASELLLYIVHGTLHLIGMEDDTPELKQGMQEQETRYLAEIGLQRPSEHPSQETSPEDNR